MDNFLILWYNSRQRPLYMDLTDVPSGASHLWYNGQKAGRNLNELQRAQNLRQKQLLRFVFCGTAGSVSPRQFAPMPPALGRKLPKMVFKFTPRKDLSEYEKAVDVFPVAGAAWRRGISSPAVAALHRF